MSISSRITSIEEHIEQAYDELQGLGADLTNVDKNIENISMVLDDIYDSMPQVSGEGTSLTLDDTRVGKIKSTLKGNTSQDGTPTPSSPIPVNVVSGDNKIDIVGKNLIGLGTILHAYRDNSTGKIQINDNCVGYYFPTSVLPDTITFSCVGGNRANISYYNSVPANAVQSVDYSNTNTLPRTISVNKTYSYIFIQLSYNTLDVTDIQFEKGSTASTYEPYQGNTYNIDLPEGMELCKIGNYQDYFYKGTGKNLLPNNATTQTINGVTFKVNDDKSVTLNGTASTLADFYMFGGSTDTGEYLYIPKGTYSISTPSSGWFYIGREKTLGAVVGNSALLNALSSQDCYFYGFIIRATSGSSFSNLTLFPMINEGTTALPYEPYGSKGKWLLHKEIGKSDLKDEGMVLQSINDYGIANFLVQPLETNVPNTSKLENSLCNRFSRQTTGIAQTQTEGFLRTLNAGIGQLGVYIRISSDKANTVETFKTWLENNPTYYYWALYTPTTTEITYQPLIDQLNLLEQAMSKDGQTNISQVNNDLPFIISASALKEWSV